MPASFAIDFGTTNSVACLISRDPESGALSPLPLTNRDDEKPHPSVVWYRGEDVVVGRHAKEQLHQLGLGVFGDIVRSPKVFLGSPRGISVGGVIRPTVDVVSHLFAFIKQDALSRGLKGSDFDRAVVTVPVGMPGIARSEMRQAALKAGIHIYQFVHEPLAALYGHLRHRPDYRNELARLEDRLVLVFDWGGGTLDLTLCQLHDGMLTQIANLGDHTVGGDFFDLRLKQLLRQKHEEEHPQADWLRLQPTSESRLLESCEDVKIALSDRDSTNVLIPSLLATSGPEKDLRAVVSRVEFESAVADLVRKGLGQIDAVLDLIGLPRDAIDFCLATGGMIAMPAIQEGLREMLGMNRLRIVPNGATIISEGAAWIAHDDVQLQLSKGIELLHANDCYVAIVPQATALPREGQAIQHRFGMYCVDPSDGFAKFLFARPKWPSERSHNQHRVPYAHLSLAVSIYSKPLLERLDVEVEIDDDLIAHLRAFSKLSGETAQCEVHDLEFGVALGDGHVGT